MAIIYDGNEEAAIKCDDCGTKVPMRYGRQAAPWDEHIRVWDDDTDLCPQCYKKREDEES